MLKKTGNKLKAKIFTDLVICFHYLQYIARRNIFDFLPSAHLITLHLHVSRGDNVICINLMSLSKEDKKKTWTPAETS